MKADIGSAVSQFTSRLSAEFQMPMQRRRYSKKRKSRNTSKSKSESSRQSGVGNLKSEIVRPGGGIGTRARLRIPNQRFQNAALGFSQEDKCGLLQSKI